MLSRVLLVGVGVLDAIAGGTASAQDPECAELLSKLRSQDAALLTRFTALFDLEAPAPTGARTTRVRWRAKLVRDGERWAEELSHPMAAGQEVSKLDRWRYIL